MSCKPLSWAVGIKQWNCWQKSGCLIWNWAALWRGEYRGALRQWLRWYDALGNWVPTEAEREHQKELAQQQVEQAQQQVEQAQQQVERERQQENWQNNKKN